jgi:uncharacterized protein YneF (UPF0154 family)
MDYDWYILITVVWGLIMFVFGLFLGYREASKKVDKLIKELVG